MITDLVLPVLGFLAIVIGVLGEAPDLREKGWKALNVWGYAAISVGLFIAVFTITRSFNDANDREQILSRMNELKKQLANEASRIRPTDFQIRVIVDYRIAAKGPLPETIPIAGKLGKAFYQGELVNLKSERTIRGGGRGPGFTAHRYYAANLTFGDLENYPYLNSLNGQTFTAVFDTNKFPPSLPSQFASRNFWLDLYIQGRHFVKMSGSDGRFERVLNFNESPASSILKR